MHTQNGVFKKTYNGALEKGHVLKVKKSNGLSIQSRLCYVPCNSIGKIVLPKKQVHKEFEYLYKVSSHYNGMFMVLNLW